MAKQKKFKVHVVKTTTTYVDIDVEANDEMDAYNKANDKIVQDDYGTIAKGIVTSENTDYAILSTKEVK